MTNPWPQRTTKGGGPAPAPPATKKPVAKSGHLVVTVASSTSGKPVGGAQVRLTGPESAKATSSRAGKVEFPHLTPGSYQVDVSAVDYSPGSAMANVRSGETAKASLSLESRAFDVKMVEVTEVFGPGAEKVDIKYKIDDPGKAIVKARIEITDKNKKLVQTVQLTKPEDYKHGDHDVKDWWDGKKSDGSFVSYPDSSYTLKLIAENEEKATKSSEKTTKVEIFSLKLLLHGPQLEKVGSEFRAYFERNQRATPNTISSKAIVFVEATALFKSKVKFGTVATSAKVALDWQFEDPACDLSSVSNAKAKLYIQKAIDYKKNDTMPKGDNCHKDRGGKRGDGTHKHFNAHAGFTLSADAAPNFHANAKSATEDTGTFEIETKTATETLSGIATLHNVREKDLKDANPALGTGTLPKKTKVKIPKRGKSVIDFETSHIAGDNYKILAKVHDTDVKAETDIITVWRKVPVETLQRMSAAHTCDSFEPAMRNQYLPASTSFYDATADVFDLPANTNVALRDPLWPYPPGFPLIQRQGYPVAPANDTTYENDMTNASYNAEYKYEADIHAGAGIQLIWAHILRKAGRPVYVTSGAPPQRRNTGGEDGEREGGGWNTTGGGTNRIIIYHLFTLSAAAVTPHEMGHLLNLRHQTNTGGGAASPADHDPGDAAPAAGAGGCLMRGDANSDHFCGKCLLKLRGWTISALTGAGF